MVRSFKFNSFINIINPDLIRVAFAFFLDPGILIRIFRINRIQEKILSRYVYYTEIAFSIFSLFFSSTTMFIWIEKNCRILMRTTFNPDPRFL